MDNILCLCSIYAKFIIQYIGWSYAANVQVNFSSLFVQFISLSIPVIACIVKDIPLKNHIIRKTICCHATNARMSFCGGNDI